MKNERIVGIICVALLISVFAPIIPNALAKDGKTLVVGTSDRLEEISPTNCYDYYTWHVFFETCEGLVDYKPGTVELVPKLAESWDVSEDGTVYTFYLRKGVTFTDGEPFNAQAMKWSMDRAFKLDGPKGAVFLIKDIVEKVEVIDDYTVRFTLKAPDADFLARMTNPPAFPLSPKSTPKNDFARGRFAGTGPYILADYTPDVRLVYEAYANYWGPKPKSTKVIEVLYRDATALRLAIETGEVDVAYRTFEPTDILDLKKNPNLRVLEGPTLSIRYNVFNAQMAPFDDVLVRQAIAAAVDREAIVSQVFSGLNDPLYSMVPPGLWSHLDVCEPRNLTKAQELLKEAGYSEKNPLKITLWFTPEHYGTTESSVAVVEAKSLEETGMIKVSIESLEWAEYAERQAEGLLGFFLLGWYPDFISPDNFLSPFISTSGGQVLGAHFSDLGVDTALSAARVTEDPAIRTELYEALQKIDAELVITLPLWSNKAQVYAVAKPNVHGVVLDLTSRFRTELIWKE